MSIVSQMFTTITVPGEHNAERWKVPRGFGVRYARVADSDHPYEPEHIRSVLNLIGYDAPIGVIAGWPLRQRVEAIVYASNVHARAGDVAAWKHPRLDWLPEPWMGEEGKGIAPRGCTELTS